MRTGPLRDDSSGTTAPAAESLRAQRATRRAARAAAPRPGSAPRPCRHCLMQARRGHLVRAWASKRVRCARSAAGSSAASSCSASTTTARGSATPSARTTSAPSSRCSVRSAASSPAGLSQLLPAAAHGISCTLYRSRVVPERTHGISARCCMHRHSKRGSCAVFHMAWVGGLSLSAAFAWSALWLHGTPPAALRSVHATRRLPAQRPVLAARIGRRPCLPNSCAEVQGLS